MNRRLLSVEEVSQLLGVGTGRCYELVRENLIPSVKLGRQVRIDAMQLDKWINDGGQALPGGWRKKTS